MSLTDSSLKETKNMKNITPLMIIALCLISNPSEGYIVVRSEEDTPSGKRVDTNERK